MHNEVPIITIDGPSGTGKGTVSLALAKYLNWHFLDSGVIYRVLAYAARKQGVDLSDGDALAALGLTLDLSFIENEQNIRIEWAAEDVTQAIRTEQCGQDASQLAALPQVRTALLARLRAFAKHPGLVTDGRDMGTVVFPKAELKIFLNASVSERAKRRCLQLQKSGIHVSLAQVVEEITARDQRDTSRLVAPLKAATDAIIIDTTNLDAKQVLSHILSIVQKSVILQQKKGG